MRTRVLLPLSCLLLTGLAGCFADDDLSLTSLGSAFSVDASQAWRAGEALLWTGAELAGPDFRDEEVLPTALTGLGQAPCDAGRCERVPFTVSEPIDLLTVAIEWEGQDEDHVAAGNYIGLPRVMMDLRIEQAGKVVVDGRESSHYAGVARMEDVAPGDYEAVVAVHWGTSTYQGSIAAGERPQMFGSTVTGGADAADGAGDANGAGDALLPDLVMLPPDHLTISTPIPREAEPVLSQAAPGCGPDELAEDQDRRCLRFAGILGNDGDGPIELVLAQDEALLSPALGADWRQRIHHEDGEVEETVVGSAAYHPVHGHYHILDFVETKLYHFDEEHGARGDETRYGRKTGFCIIDGGLIDQRDPGAVLPRYFGGGCCYMFGFCQLDMTRGEEFIMGVSAGWYDIYPWYRADQYVEITGLPDGTYELVSRINPVQNLVETDVHNNEASTVFRLSGDEVETLSMATQADVGPHPDAAWDEGAAAGT